MSLLKNTSAALPTPESTTVTVTGIYFSYGIARLRTGARAYESVHPFFVMTTGNASVGLFLRTSNDVEVTLSPNQVATFRVAGGVLDFFVFFGASPAEVVAQYTRLVGLPAMPSLRFIVSGQTASTNRRVVPFTLFLPEEIKKNGMDDPLRLAVFRDVGGAVLTCRTGRGSVERLVDLTHPAADDEWSKMFDLVQVIENFKTAGVLWLEAFTCLKSDSNVTDCPAHARRFPGDVCGTAQLHRSAYSDVRNAYGYLMARMAHRVITPKRQAYPALATISDTFPGIGQWNVFWSLARVDGAKGLIKAVRDIQLYSMMGLPYFLASLCPVQDVENSTIHGICSLWLNLAAFFPVVQRVKVLETSNDASTEEMTPEKSYMRAVKGARSLRSKFLPHLYTLIFKSSTTGAMIVRPLAFEFPGERLAHTYNTQFMLGSHLMVVPKTQYEDSRLSLDALLLNSTPTPVYLPPGIWYEWQSWRQIISRGSVVYMSPENTPQPILFVRGGGILVTRNNSRFHERAKDRALAATSFLELTVCLDAAGSAYGDLIAASAEHEAPNPHLNGRYTHFNFFYSRNFLAGYCSPCDYRDVLRKITVLGLASAPSRVEFNGKELSFNVSKQVFMVEAAYHILTEPFIMKLT
ncbi:lysosomal alpha-glucosidase-like [Dermacentor variabilis]|uniref:lysosomal alpha-glucosidase-like n=1 Tax=Dermacentor variabilis TaxID=34621 RepID=UPI003F5C7E56